MMDWMVRSAAAGVIIALATWLGSLALVWLGRPRRWAWAAGLVAAALMPFLGLILPARPAPASAAALSPADVVALLAANAGAGGAAASSLPGWLPGAIWALATLLLLLEQGYALRRLALLRRNWTPARLDGQDVLIAEHVGPAVVGVARPAIVVPPWLVAAPEQARALALAHEREHVRAGDTRLLAAGTLLGALLPWSPALWWLQRRLRDAVETDCDARVLGAGCDVVAYGRMLVEAAARPGRPLARVALVERRNQLERRIRAMKSQLPSRPVARAAAAAAAVTALLVAACELSSPPPEPTETRPAAPMPRAAPATANQLTATDTGEIRRIIIDRTAGGERIRAYHKDGRVETRYTAVGPQGAKSDTGLAVGYGTATRPELMKDSASAYAADYAAGRAAAEQGLRQGAGTGAGVGRGTAQGPAAGMHMKTAIGAARPYVLLLDGREAPPQTMQELDPNRIRSVNVIKVEKVRANLPVTVPDTVKVFTK